jgi:drug/metabolite transporter (DMT)-like permease
MIRNTFLGLLAALSAALIGSGWQLASRHGVTTHLGPLELAVLRYGIPAIVLLPLLFRAGFLPRGLPWPKLLLLVVSGGLPFGWVVVQGAQWAPAAHIGVFVSGSIPLFTALGGWLLTRQRLAWQRMAGLVLIVIGLAVFGLSDFAMLAASWRGDLLFLIAAVMWAIHTLAFQRSGLNPWHGAALFNFWSAVLLIPVVMRFGAPKLFTAPWPEVAFQALGQGVMAGLLGLVAYMAAITRLGAARASLSAALVPLLTALGGAWLLNEPLTAPTLAALALVMGGVAQASTRQPIRSD